MKFISQREKRIVFEKAHIVPDSDLPILTTIAVITVMCSWLSMVKIHKCGLVKILFRMELFYALAILIWILFGWFSAVIRETGEGEHADKIQEGLGLGMVLFILSEIMLFFSFFWAFFHYSITPSQVLGNVWPPESIQLLDVFGLPLNNTILLLSSGLLLTIGHWMFVTSQGKEDVWMSAAYVLGTAFVGVMFLVCQLYEYFYGLTFNCSETVFGSIFYLTTGFHGAHVIIGTIFLIFCGVRLVLTALDVKSKKWESFKFSKDYHFGFEAAAWYWHFVDVVWIFLYLTIYWWSEIPNVELNIVQTMEVACENKKC
jgi:heme/copper-type cytochrome/quinol oxidase subunit 3